ncbi:hypothetical protein AB9P05_23100 [Roseivirga sp. BDSF3-8]|uniref:hypothetical protein n=1 Tax=Roseivirga sp. BDSF3-8 TaxID=3241598 RepID=UPI003531E532
MNSQYESIISEFSKIEEKPGDISGSSLSRWEELYMLGKDFVSFLKVNDYVYSLNADLIEDYIKRLRDIAYKLSRGKSDRNLEEEGNDKLRELYEEVYEGKYTKLIEENGKTHYEYPQVPYEKNVLILATRLRTEALQAHVDAVLREKDSLLKLRTTMEDAAKAQLSAKYVQTFQEEAKNHRKFYKRWLRAGIATVVLFAGLFTCLSDLFVPNLDKYIAFTSNIEQVDQQNDGEANQKQGSNGVPEKSLVNVYLFANLFSRLLYVSLGIFLIRFCFRQYSLQRHLYTENTHKAKALDSFKLFVETVDPKDKETRHTLVLELAKAIFENRPTGYLGAKAEANDPKVSLTDLMKMMPKQS